MIRLRNNCWISEPTVSPKNWQTQSASVKKDWYIQYYFHDPAFKDHPKLKNGKLRIIKGMNKEKTVAGRRDSTRKILQIEMQILEVEGYNPITKDHLKPIEIVYEIEPDTLFLDALQKSFERLKISKHDKYSIKSCLKWIKTSARQLRFDSLEIQQVRRKHIKLILEQCAVNQPRWSPQNYNHYRSYLMMIFKELLELDAIELNPIKEISKLPIPRKIRETLTDDQRKKIDTHLKTKDPFLRRYIHIFFHSGSRIAELSRLQAKDVDLPNQRFKITVLKRRRKTEEWRPIKTIALPFWKKVMKECQPEDYLFAAGLKPSSIPVVTNIVTSRWREAVKWPLSKGGLGIKVDFYSLKHLNLDETAAKLNLKDAAAMAGHTTPVITLRYAQGEKDRQNERLKKVGNKFA